MSPQNLFNVILKVLGLFFLRDFLISVPGILSLISVLLTYSGGNGISPVIGGLLVLAIIGSTAYTLLFRTNWVIEKLHLTEGLEEESFSFHIHRSTVLAITVVVVGALMVLNTLPNFLRLVFLLFQAQKTTTGSAYPKPDTTLVIVNLAQIIIGLLLLGNVQKAVAFIELKRRRASMEEDPEP